MKYTSSLWLLWQYSQPLRTQHRHDVHRVTAQACDAWNKDATLYNGLADKWIKNDKDRGYKIIPPVSHRLRRGDANRN